MIVKNEENTLARCLNSVRGIVDEIIIVDTGSTDSTKQIASRFTNKIYDFVWVDDFSLARNYSFSKATKDYILWLDADDLILPEDREKFKNLKSSLSSDADVVMMKYNTGSDDNGKSTFSFYRERLSKRNRNFQWREPVHEYLEINGNIINVDICITHGKSSDTHSGRNLKIYENILVKGVNLTPRGMYYYARELKDNGRFKDASIQFILFLESGSGWVEDNIAACGELAKCYLMQEEEEKALSAMFRSFIYDSPRAEICCQIGYYFKNKEQFKQAIFWFETALNLKKPENSWGFIQHDFWDYIPCMECVVCYDKLGDYERAESYNERAAAYKPDSSAVLYNRNYFANLKLTD
jgi:glycosyltransferase involved in cell wall biosynthesis